MPKYYEISEAAAKRAKDMNSYSDYAPGSATAGYRAMVDEAYALAEKQKAQVDPMYHDKIDALVDRRQIIPVKKLVQAVDPNAFVIVCDAHEILGEGFGTYDPTGL